jgi:alkylhydroperoxidase/carboxymuconolactone decarboxylase family protein YurZ
LKITASIHITIMAAFGKEKGIPLHVGFAKLEGVTMEGIVHAALVGLPPAGHKVTRVIPLIVGSCKNG